MSVLQMEAQVWPTPNHVKLMGNKLELIKHLDLVARKLETPRPKTFILRKGDLIPKDAVLKRTHSDAHQHVLLPGKYVGMWDELDEDLDGAQWFAQEYVSLLRKVGEWRCIMAGGRIMYVIHTAYDSHTSGWRYMDVREHPSLSELR
jgi:hypothetical protein